MPETIHFIPSLTTLGYFDIWAGREVANPAKLGGHRGMFLWKFLTLLSFAGERWADLLGDLLTKSLIA